MSLAAFPMPAARGPVSFSQCENESAWRTCRRLSAPHAARCRPDRHPSHRHTRSRAANAGAGPPDRCQHWRRRIRGPSPRRSRRARDLAGTLRQVHATCTWPASENRSHGGPYRLAWVPPPGSLVHRQLRKIKVIKRMAYGYRDDAYFFLKIRVAFPGNRRGTTKGLPLGRPFCERNRASAFQEGQQIRVELVFMRIGDAVWATRVDD